MFLFGKEKKAMENENKELNQEKIIVEEEKLEDVVGGIVSPTPSKGEGENTNKIIFQ